MAKGNKTSKAKFAWVLPVVIALITGLSGGLAGYLFSESEAAKRRAERLESALSEYRELDNSKLEKRKQLLGFIEAHVGPSDPALEKWIREEIAEVDRAIAAAEEENLRLEKRVRNLRHQAKWAARITEPELDTRLSANTLRVKGVVPMALWGHDYWIASCRDENGECWPKTQVAKDSEAFNVNIIEAGGPGEVYVSLLEVKSSVTKDFAAWQRKGNATGHHGALEIDPETMRVVAQVKVEKVK